MKQILIDDDGYAVTKKPKRTLSLKKLDGTHAAPVFFTLDELRAMPPGEAFIFDVESYINYFLVAFKHIASGKVAIVEDSPEIDLDVGLLAYMMHKFLIVGFNSNNYDVPIVSLAVMRGLNCAELKQITNRIICGEQPRTILKEYEAWTITCNHIDVIEIPPAQGSLKKFAAMLHCKRMQELPYPPDKQLTRDEAYNVMLYCVNDLDNTQLIYEELSVEITLREHLGKKYDQDLRSKSDPQIAEAIIRAEVAKVNGKYSKPTKFDAGHTFDYEPPAFLKFQTPLLQNALEKIRNMEFEVAESGYVVAEELKGLELPIGSTVYKMGKGGLHSKEKSVAYKATDEYEIVDDDVTSYYPWLILNSGMFPENMGEAFLTVYKELVESRLADKKAKRYSDAESKKVVVNGTFGKLSNPYSAMYAPNMLIYVTLTGQLSLLMLIEALELVGIKVISANTDGIIKYVHKSQYATLRRIVKEWEAQTGLQMEETKYAALYSRDINNYIAVKLPDDKGVVKVKGKGAYFDPRYEQDKTSIYRFKKNPQNTICLKAIYALLVDGTPIEKTITECREIHHFVTVRNVKGGGYKDGYYLGKVVRWYYAKGQKGDINYILSGNKVPDSDGAKPLLDLPDAFPTDIDYARYIAITVTMLENIGYLKRSRIPGLFD
ncbi:MAG: hypothetical protein JWR85_4167 [Marmoricola sp.]|nr:hypothetical protein [Marmoricola sp.]